MDIEGKVILITGGTGFLGTEFCRHFLNLGARVIIFDITTKEFIDNTLPTIKKETGKEPWVSQVDITKPEIIQNELDEAIKHFDHIDVLINNAALNPVPGSRESAAQFSPYEKYPPDLWKKEVEVGLTGTQLMTQAVAREMMKQKSGSIINVSSIYGYVAPDNRIYDEGKFKSVAYATVKSALLNFTRAWASYLGPYNVRVNSVVFGGVENNQNPAFIKKYSDKTMLGRMADKKDFNGALTLLASNDSSYITGSTFVLDGGFSAW